MVYFTEIRKTKHYELFHESEVLWFDVVDVILKSSKNIRKKFNNLEIENKKYYILCVIRDDILYVINAKRK